jgi:hypothetical protein
VADRDINVELSIGQSSMRNLAYVRIPGTVTIKAVTISTRFQIGIPNGVLPQEETIIAKFGNVITTATIRINPLAHGHG